MNVSLTRELEEFVQERVQSGRYHSASEVIREALRLLEEQDRVRELHFEKLRQDIAIGIAQAERGQIIGGERVFARLRARNAKVSQRGK